jgi:apolipoprotein D and lipocalin family protein
MLNNVLLYGLILMSVKYCSAQAELVTVDKVDLAKYSGKWYDISHLPARFLDGCDCITAHYSLNPDGSVIVFNQCRNRKGESSSIKGKALAVNGSGNAKLKVQFFWPFRSDYYIIGLAEDYSWAVVGTPSRKYLWILSRYPQMDPPLYNDLIKMCGNKGFRVEFLTKTNQVGCGH